MTIKEMYQYWYYGHYIINRWGEDKYRDEKAFGMIIFMEIILLSSIPFYYTVFIDNSIEVSDRVAFIVIIVVWLIIMIFNYIVLMVNDRWKGIVAKFDAWPKKKNRIGGWIVFGVDMLIFANMGFAIYVLSQSAR